MHHNTDILVDNPHKWPKNIVDKLVDIPVDKAHTPSVQT